MGKVVYLYSNSQNANVYLSRNIIACNAVLSETRRDTTLGTICPHFLFFTARKISLIEREKGIADKNISYPVTLAFSINEDDNREVVCLGQDGTLRIVSIQEYDIENDLGFFVEGEYPLHNLTDIIFDNEDEKLFFKLPSKDCWYPEDKFSICGWGNEVENIDVNIDEKNIAEQFNIDLDKIELDVRESEKYRAIILNLYNATKGWRHDKYEFSVDGYLAQVFGLDIKEIDEVSYKLLGKLYTQINENVEKETIDIIELLKSEDIANREQYIFSYILSEFFKKPAEKTFNNEEIVGFVSDVLERLSSKQEIQTIVDRWKHGKKLLDNETGISINEFLTVNTFDESIVLALLFVSRNPIDYDTFRAGMLSYKVDKITLRRAAVLWGALNGLLRVRAKEYHKDDMELWEVVDKIACNKKQEKAEQIHTPMSVMKVEGKEVVSFEEIYELFSKMEPEKLGNDICKILVNNFKLADKKNKAQVSTFMAKDGKQFKAKINSMSDDFSDADVKLIKQLISKLTTKYNKTAISNALIKQEAVFKKLITPSSEEVEKIYKKLRGR